MLRRWFGVSYPLPGPIHLALLLIPMHRIRMVFSSYVYTLERSGIVGWVSLKKLC